MHLDYREVHYAKVMLDAIFGRESFLNEIIWAYDYGGTGQVPLAGQARQHPGVRQEPARRTTSTTPRSTASRTWPRAWSPPEKRERGKLPTDVWWHTIVSPTGKEKTGYPTQKPEGILRRIINASSREGDWVLDFFAGSGTTGAVAQALGRRFVCVDENPQSIAVMTKRIPKATLLEALDD